MSQSNGTGGATIGPALGDRIERVWRAHPEGAAAEVRRTRNRGQRWFARRAGYGETAVRHWIGGRNEAPPPALRMLELLEEEAGLS